MFVGRAVRNTRADISTMPVNLSTFCTWHQIDGMAFGYRKGGNFFKHKVIFQNAYSDQMAVLIVFHGRSFSLSANPHVLRMRAVRFGPRC